MITSKIDAAVTRFRSRGASIEDRRHAVRDLADVLEALRGDIKEAMLTWKQQYPGVGRHAAGTAPCEREE